MGKHTLGVAPRQPLHHSTAMGAGKDGRLAGAAPDRGSEWQEEEPGGRGVPAWWRWKRDVSAWWAGRNKEGPSLVCGGSWPEGGWPQVPRSLALVPRKSA